MDSYGKKVQVALVKFAVIRGSLPQEDNACGCLYDQEPAI